MAEFAYNNVKNASTGHTPLSWIADTTLEFPMKKTLTFAPSQS